MYICPSPTVKCAEEVATWQQVSVLGQHLPAGELLSLALQDGGHKNAIELLRAGRGLTEGRIKCALSCSFILCPRVSAVQHIISPLLSWLCTPVPHTLRQP